MTSRFPMLVTWGPDLLEIYNDGYRTMLGSEKHPRALGSPSRDVWAEIWDVIGPMLAGVVATGLPTWSEHQELVIDRNRYPEECFFTFSYSPLFDDDGTVGGVLIVAAETTVEVMARRRMACLTNLSSSLLAAEHVADVFVLAATALAESTTDLSAADLYLRVGDQLGLVASNRRDGVSPIDPSVLLQVTHNHAPMVIGGNPEGSLPADQYVAPIGTIDGVIDGAFVAAPNPRRPFDTEYAMFLQLIANAISSSLGSVYRRSSEVDEYRLISDTLQNAMLQPAVDLPTVAARYLPAVGNLAVGGDWYDVIDLGTDVSALVVGDCVGHGLEAATVMAQLRSATRAMLLEGRDPAATLEGLDLFAATIDGALCATVVCLIIDAQNDVVTYSSAGHLPPLIATADGVVWLDQAGGLPLAVDPSSIRTNAIYQLQHNDAVIMYSDGLIERRRECLDVGFERLSDAVTELNGASVQRFADGLLRLMQPENTRDDVVVVVAHFPESVSLTG